MKKGTSRSAATRPFEFVPIAAVAVIGIVLAVAAFMLLQRYFETAAQQRFQRDATYWSTAFTGSVERHVNSLAALRAFVSASRNVTRWEFSTFAKQTLPGNPGFPAFFWVPSVAAKDRARYEADLQRDGLYGLKIHELGANGQLTTAGQRPLYRPVSYVEPFDDSRAAVGLDLAVLPVFQQLFEAADKTGQVAVSPPIESSILDDEHGPSVIVAFPFLGQSAGAPQGYALGVLKFERILQRVAAESQAPVEIAIAYNEPAFARKLIYSSIGNPAASRNINEWTRKSAFSQVTEFTVAGQHFVLGLRAPTTQSSWSSLIEPAGATLLILALAALLAQHLYSALMAKQAVERAVVLRTIQLQRANAALEEEIRQRRDAEADLRAAKDRAESANRAKSEFLATMSHELRTPLNAIIGFSSMLTKDAPSNATDEQYDDYVQQIHEGGIRLLTLINELLDLSQMDSGRIQIEEEAVHIAGMVDAAVWKMDAKAKAAGVHLRTQVAHTLPRLRADERRLQKALIHLLSNAIKFTPEGGEAEITVNGKSDGTISFEIKDNGVGIPKGREKQILEPFVQLDSTLARSHDGAGLGLAFVKRVAELHGATLSIVSELGKGTCVTMSFPASRVVRDVEVA